MARTRRRHSYRKSRRWNPDAVSAAVAAAPTKTNPHTFIKRLPDGSSVRVTPEGKVTVLDSDGSVHDRWSLKAYEVPRLLRNLKGAKRANKYDYRADAVADEYHTVSMNPRHRKARRSRKHGSYRKSRRNRTSASTRHYVHKKRGRGKVRSWRKKTLGRSRSRSNPAQFPPPYFSAMSNPKRKQTRSQKRKRAVRGMNRALHSSAGKSKKLRRARKWHRSLVHGRSESKSPRTWRASYRKTRRNSPIRKKDARALKRVLRTHHYRCR